MDVENRKAAALPVVNGEVDEAVANLQWLLTHYETMEFEETLKSLKTLIRAAQQPRQECIIMA